MSENHGNSNYSNFENLVNQFRSLLPENKIKELEYLLQHDEVEMAFETLCWVIHENKLELPFLLITALREMFEELNSEFIEERWQEIGLLKHIDSIKAED
jgi:hypothetical protein